MLIILLFTTTPSSSGPLGILGFFMCMYLSVLGVLTFLFRGLSFLMAKVIPKRNAKLLAGMKGVSLRTAYYYASVIASVPVMIVAIQSVGQVGVYQVLLILFFVVIAWIYVENRTS